MMRRFPRKQAARASALVAATVAGFAPGAGAATPQPGFGQFRPLGQTADEVNIVDAVVAPNGRTAVLWRSADFRRGRYEYRVAVGKEPARLGQPTRLVAGQPFAESSWNASLHAFPDGSFAACFASDPRKGDAVTGCSFADAAGGFGTLREVRRVSWKVRPSFAAYTRPDGRLAIITSQRVKGGLRSHEVRVLAADGSMTGRQHLATLPAANEVSAAVTDDGTLGATWVDGEIFAEEGVLTDPGVTRIAVMPGDADRFEAPETLVLPGANLPSATLTGGRRLVVNYRRDIRPGEVAEAFLVRQPDGTFSAPLALPRPTRKGYLVGTVSVLRDGTPFAMTRAFASDPVDCDMTPYSAVGVGGLTPSKTQGSPTRLSTPGQIVESYGLSELADGTLIAAWGNALRGGSQQRLEVALRAPGATTFGRSRVLPRLATDYRLATGGNHAVIVSTVANGFLEPGRLWVSAFTTTGPLPKPAKLPRFPESNCG